MSSGPSQAQTWSSVGTSREPETPFAEWEELGPPGPAQPVPGTRPAPGASTMAARSPDPISATFYVRIVGSVQGPFDGDATEAGRDGWSVGLGFVEHVRSPRDAASRQSADRHIHDWVVLTRQWGSGSTQLLSALVAQERLPTVIFEFISAGNAVQRVTLTDAAVTDLQRTIDPAEERRGPVEQVAFTFARIELEDLNGGASAGDVWRSGVSGAHELASAGAWTRAAASAESLGLGEADSGSGGAAKRRAAPMLSPFHAAIADNTITDPKLTAAFAAALTAADATVAARPGLPPIGDVAIAMVTLNDDGTRPIVGQHLDAMYYTGSMAKVMAMYAAYQLRHAANAVGATVGDVSEDEFFGSLARTFDPKIRDAVKLPGIGLIHEGGVREDLRLPKYRRMFFATKIAGGWSVDFRVNDADPAQNFFGHLREMVVESDNFEAGITIRTVGYGTINGALTAAGFYSAGQGLWLAGDYNQAPVVTINSRNDGPVKQVASCRQAARLLTLLKDGSLVDDSGASPDTANLEMLELMRQGAISTHASSIIASYLPRHAPFEVLNAKIGVGTLKNLRHGPSSSCNVDAAGHTHRCVTSELAVVRQTAPPRRTWVVCFQNVLDPINNHGADYTRLIALIGRTMNGYHP